jgi:hypothetical protein
MRSGGAQGDDLSVGRGIVIEQVAVVGAGDDLAFFNNDRPHGDLTGSSRQARLLQGKPHPCCIVRRGHGKSLGGFYKIVADRRLLLGRALARKMV